MFRRIWNSVFGRRPKSTVIHLSTEQMPASSAEVAGTEAQPSGFTETPVDTLTAICDAYWNSFLDDSNVAPEDAFSTSSVRDYNQYVNAINELSVRGPEILDWAIARVRHVGYDAREQVAWLLGALASKNQLGEKRQTVIDELTWLATRSIEDDTKEAQANSAAVIALGKTGDLRAVTALRHILTVPEWDPDDLQWEAAEILGELAGESFMDCDEPVAVARDWLQRHPDYEA